MSLSEQENKELYNNDKKRYNKEKNFRIKNIKFNNENKEIIKLLEELYRTKLKEVRKTNNYVKHNGHLEEYEENTTKIYSLTFNKKDPLETIRKAMYNMKNDVNPLTYKAPKGKKVVLNNLASSILEIVEELLIILDKTMTVYIDKTYKELLRMMKSDKNI